MKTRSILVILFTLIIGFILGMLTSAQLRSQRLNPVRVYFSEERFRDGFYKAIQPDDQQKAQIEIILDKYARINSEIQTNFRKELDESMKEFRIELDSNLTKDQIARLKELDDKRQQLIRHNRKNRDNDSIGRRQDRRHFDNDRPGPRRGGRFPDRDSSLRDVK
jgi:hypothetical protein